MDEADVVDILLVEDNEDDAELTLHALGKDRFANRVRVVRDGLEALDFLLRQGKYADLGAVTGPKLILLDMKLPKISGVETLRRIREHPEIASIPVVILTSSKEARDVEASYELGVNSYIVKPVNFEHFRKVVRDVGFYWAVLNRSPFEADAKVS